MKFSDFVCFKASVPDLQSQDRDSAIAELVESLKKAGKFSDAEAEKVRKAVIKREKEASTGYGKGVALPHVKHACVKKAVATVGQSKEGIDFSALDKQPVYSVILIISPVDDPSQHLQIMEKIFNHLQKEKFLKFLRQSTSIDEIKDLLIEADDNPEL